MKRSFCIIFALLATIAISAQEKKDKPSKPEYQFTTIKENPISAIGNQYRSGTCWCFSALSFVESELLRKGGKEVNLSEMWVVGHAYHDRAVKYVRMDGKMGFSAGSGFGDVFTVIDKYGIVPQDTYSGMNYGTELPEQAELDAVLKAYVDAIVRKPNKVLSTAWLNGYDGILKAYLGEYPADFSVDGVKYTPETYRDKVVKFNKNDYVNICSFSDTPWYEECPIEVCDNWRNFNGYNVPLEDLMRIIYNAIDNGYTVLWGGDVSEKGFTRQGIGVALKPEKKVKAGSDQEHWVGKDTEKKDTTTVAKLPEEIDEVTDSLRLDAYNRKMTTDDHGMHIYGYAKDQNGTQYFMVKNSWGENNKYKGTWYMSEKFIAFKTLNIAIHKDALPKDLKKKLNVK
ncbi:MAG: aminopeptidase [Bacteroidales bacterium]|nr:aminopeptidase [Bacteroidales bacterium]